MIGRDTRIDRVIHADDTLFGRCTAIICVLVRFSSKLPVSYNINVTHTSIKITQFMDSLY